MRETPEDIGRLQELLDASYARAGAHLTSIHTPAVRIRADELVRRLDGMQVFVVATTTSDGRPRTGPVDTFLYRGRLTFGTATNAVRARHLSRSPEVSATHVRGETLVVTAHGTARSLELKGADADFDQFLRGHYGDPTYDEHLAESPYWAIDAEWLFAADMSGHASPADSA
jgi:hypothetical protein